MQAGHNTLQNYGKYYIITFGFCQSQTIIFKIRSVFQKIIQKTIDFFSENDIMVYIVVPKTDFICCVAVISLKSKILNGLLLLEE